MKWFASILLSSVVLSAPLAHAEMHAANLQCEYKVAPLGIDRPTPRLSWIVESDRADEVQTAYRVLVASAPQVLAHDRGDLWDSGDVKSRETTAIRYAGKPLTSAEHAWWKVQTCDRDGRAGAWSEPQTWSMGLLAADDWRAKWIGYDAGRITLETDANPLDGASWIAFAGDATPTPAENRWFEKTITLPADIRIANAQLTIAADDRFVGTLNGQSIGRGTFKPPASIDVRPILKPGDNALRIEVTNDAPSPTGLIGCLSVTDDAGKTLRFASDESWRSSDTATGMTHPSHVIGDYGAAPWGKLDAKYLLTPPAYVRRSFELDKPIKRATLYYATLGLADVYVNGQRATDDYFTSGWTDYRIRSYYRTYDVTDKVRRGENAIAAVVADGWYSGHVGFERKRDRYGKYPRLRAQLDVEFDDGTHEVVASDESWKAANGATRTADLLAGETYDAQAEPVGWNAPGFDDDAWTPVVVGSEMAPLMQAHPAQPVRVIQTYSTKSIAEPTPMTYVVDFGQNLAGVVRLIVHGRAGQTITLRHGERLNPDGTLYTTNLRGADATDRYTCRGDAAGETWSPRFTFHGFQYVEITGLDAPPTPDALVALALSSDAPIAGSFESSNADLNQLHHNIVQTQRMNFIDVPTDCPQRDERLGWTGDAQVYIRTATLNVDVHAFFDKWLVDLADQQRADGEFPCVAPARDIGGDDGGPAWADAGVICPWTIYDVYGDRDLLARHYPSMQKFVEFMVKRSTPDLLPPKEFHCFGDWLSINAETPKDLIYVAYFAHDADLMQRAATALGHADDAQKYADLFVRLKATFNKAFVAADGTVKGATQCGYVLPIVFDLLNDAGTAEAGRRLVADIEARGDHLSTGFIGTKDLMLALDHVGRNDVACRLVHQDTFPSWGFSIRHGATSIWERWNGWTPESGFGDPGMNSFAHYSFGAVYQWMAQSIGGIRNAGNAYGEVVIEPTLDPKLTFARTSYASVHGTIVTDWKRDADRVTLTVTIPANVTALVRLPTDHDAGIRIGGQPIVGAQVKDGRVEFPVGSGRTTYDFPATNAKL